MVGGFLGPLRLLCVFSNSASPPSPLFQAAQQLLGSFGPRTFLFRIVRSSGDKARFDEVHMQLTTCMLVGSIGLHDSFPLSPLASINESLSSPLLCCDW